MDNCDVNKVLVTGATGFIGSELLHDPRCSTFLRCSREMTANASIVKEINNRTIWGDSLKGIDVIVHLAGIAHDYQANVDLLADVNFQGTIRLARKAQESGVKKFIFLSSVSVYGSSCDISDNSIPSPNNIFSEIKYKTECELQKIADESNMDVVIIRTPMVYGIGAPGNFGKLVKLISRVPVLPFGLVNNSRSIISVRNISDFIYHCVVNSASSGKVFVVSDGTPVSTKALSSAISKGLNRSVIQIPVPVIFMSIAARVLGRLQQVNQLLDDIVISSTAAKKVLNWTPPETMAEAMAKLSNSRDL